MGYVDKYEFKHIKDNTTVPPTYKTECSVGFKISSNFIKGIRIIKGRVPLTCVKCKKEYGKGVRYVGDQWGKICFNCFTEFTENGLKELDVIKSLYEDIQNDYNKNKNKWTKEAVLGKLINGD